MKKKLSVTGGLLVANLQLVLTGGKGCATDISVHLSESGDWYLVFLGLALLERVPRDPRHFLYKLLVARLVNCGIGMRRLERVFGHDHKTLRAWGDALKCGDCERIQRAFSGQGAERKVTAEMASFVQGHYLGLKRHCHDYRKRIGKAVQQRFGATVSHQTLSALFTEAEKNECKVHGEGSTSAPPSANNDGHDSGVTPRSDDQPMLTDQSCGQQCSNATGESADFGSGDHGRSVDAVKHSPTPEGTVAADGQKDMVGVPVSEEPAVCGRVAETALGDESAGNSEDCACAEPARLCVPAVKHSPTPAVSGAKATAENVAGALSTFLPVSGTIPRIPQMVHHAGQILLSPWLDAIGFDRPSELQMHEQWLGQILQGAVNIEQSKTICGESLSLFTGPVRADRRLQRDQLHAQATTDVALATMARNARVVREGPGVGSVFYYDPYTKEYTGDEPFLKGWCARRRGIVRVLNMDFIHTRLGDPCFVFHTDNYYDLRERFFLVLQRFDELFPADQREGRTWVIDRGIFGLDTFKAFFARRDFLITWEKGYKGDAWDKSLTAVQFFRTRERNRKGDVQTWCFRCQEASWPKHPGMRRIVVRVTPPNGVETEVSVLCSNPFMRLEEAVTLIFNRWIQENDFWYLDTYFGISQLTAYASQSYEDIAHQLRDRPVECPEYRELKNRHRERERQFGAALVAQDKNRDTLEAVRCELRELQDRRTELWTRTQELLQAIDSGEAPYKRHAEVESAIPRLRQMRQRVRHLHRRLPKLESKADELHDRAERVKSQCADLRTTMDALLKEDSRLKLLIEHNYRRPDTRCKAVMDALRITARNTFRRLLEIFRPIYDNYRDDHVMLRTLTRAAGLLWQDPEGTVHVRIWLPQTLPRRVVRAFRRLLQTMTILINGHFAGRSAPVAIGLLEPPAQLPMLARSVGV